MTAPIDFPSATARFSLPLLFAGQAQKEFTVNETVSMIAALLHASVEGESDEAPATAVDGECWLVGSSPGGAWAGKEAAIACFAAGDWLFVDPLPGMRCHDRSSGVTLLFDGAWQRPVAPAEPAGGATQDTEARSAIASLINGLIEAGLLEERA